MQIGPTLTPAIRHSSRNEAEETLQELLSEMDRVCVNFEGANPSKQDGGDVCPLKCLHLMQGNGISMRRVFENLRRA